MKQITLLSMLLATNIYAIEVQVARQSIGNYQPDDISVDYELMDGKVGIRADLWRDVSMGDDSMSTQILKTYYYKVDGLIYNVTTNEISFHETVCAVVKGHYFLSKQEKIKSTKKCSLIKSVVRESVNNKNEVITEFSIRLSDSKK